MMMPPFGLRFGIDALHHHAVMEGPELGFCHGGDLECRGMRGLLLQCSRELLALNLKEC